MDPLDGYIPSGNVPYRLLARFGSSDSASVALSLNGQPPGAPYDGVAVPFGDGHVEFPVPLQYFDEQMIGYDRVILMVDDDLDGNLEQVGQLEVADQRPDYVSGATEIDPGDAGGLSRPFLALPNPFSRSTKITFRLDGSTAEPVTLQVFDLGGRQRRELMHDASLEPGVHSVEWDGRDDLGVEMPVGVYFLKLTMGRTTDSVKITLLR
jgi:hypothetical protein